jgi:single-stranded DNA-binding protein
MQACSALRATLTLSSLGLPGIVADKEVHHMTIQARNVIDTRIGFLGADPEHRSTKETTRERAIWNEAASGSPTPDEGLDGWDRFEEHVPSRDFVTFSIATTDERGQTIWTRIVVWHPERHRCLGLLRKGDQVEVKGWWQELSWTASDGSHRTGRQLVLTDLTPRRYKWAVR